MHISESLLPDERNGFTGSEWRLTRGSDVVNVNVCMCSQRLSGESANVWASEVYVSELYVLKCAYALCREKMHSGTVNWAQFDNYYSSLSIHVILLH